MLKKSDVVKLIVMDTVFHIPQVSRFRPKSLIHNQCQILHMLDRANQNLITRPINGHWMAILFLAGIVQED